MLLLPLDHQLTGIGITNLFIVMWGWSMGLQGSQNTLWECEEHRLWGFGFDHTSCVSLGRVDYVGSSVKCHW